ncbi:MAG: corrinoid protein [Deltaproteobacteria bacterium]|nr:corrinoid protein [Deltaproteobacteria bacterium]MBW1920042.1 corrinoid protein [Deltaproteobacteria bacterium]MBW1934933.1 corrinoid protein [Deltaproteobacteria bacterium]MBW1977179.1 corrinoid protein [Deltaproteobacteria bacterium]MBW2045605.1 corrinoid protein [Deltaproteobacteria bacterium]
MYTRELINKISFNVIQGRVEAEDEGFDEGLEGQPAVTELVHMALEKGVDPKAIVIDGLTKAMELVGEKFERGEYLIPDMLASAECVSAAMDIMGSHLVHAGVKSKGKFVIATVAGDLHDIGKNIVSIMLKGSGYEVVDLGSDVPTEKIVTSVKEQQAPYLGLSALLTSTMWVMEEVINKLKKEGLYGNVKVLIGGAPISQSFADKIGAYAYCRNAFEAIEILKGETR